MKKLTIISLVFFANILMHGQSTEYLSNLIENKEFVKAEKLIAKALTKDPENNKMKEFSGDLASARKNWDEATTIYEELLEFEPKNANYNFKYGGALGMQALEMPKIKAAFYIDDIKHHLAEAARLDENHIEARWALVKLYLKLPSILGGSEETSQKYADQLTAISKVDGFLAKAFIAEEAKRLKEAEDYYKMAVMVGGSPHCYEQLAIFYNEKAKNHENALKTYEEAYRKHKKEKYLLKIAEISVNHRVQVENGLKSIDLFFKNEKEISSAEKEKASLLKAKLLNFTNNKKEALLWANKVLQLKPNNKEAQKLKNQL